MSIILYNNKTKKLDFFKDNEILSKLYYQEISLPKKSIIKDYIKNKNNNRKIILFLKIKI